MSALTPLDRPLHARAIEDARAGRFHEAKRGLGRLAVAYPNEQTLVDQYNAACTLLAEKQAGAKASLEAQEMRSQSPPPATYTLRRSAAARAPVPKLVKVTTTKNEITDVGAWFSKNKIRLPVFFVPPSRDMLFAPGSIQTSMVVNTLAGFVYTEYTLSPHLDSKPLPLEIPLAYGRLPLSQAIASDPYLVAIYGAVALAVFERVAAHARGADQTGSAQWVAKALFDFTNYRHPPASVTSTHKVGEATLSTKAGTVRGDIVVDVESIAHELEYALAQDGVLYVSHGNLGYAKESRGQNAYVTAIDIASGEMLWRSAPLTSNAHSFALVSGGLVAGYGFTAEPDFVFVLDRATGRVAQKIPVPSGPEYIVRGGGGEADRVFVRTYDTDVVFLAKLP